MYANNCGHLNCGQHKNKKLILSTEDLIISKNSSNIKDPKYCHAQVSLDTVYHF